jgi:glyoxylase-like metal-dependent hydrolase (beta-lactamase superfamily II)
VDCEKFVGQHKVEVNEWKKPSGGYIMSQSLIQLAENIWLFPHDPEFNTVQSSVGIIVDRDQAVLVDAGNSPRLARQIKDEFKRHRLPPISHIIYTHHHWDHISGACEFQVPVVAHTKCQAILLEEAKKPWSSEYLRQEIKRNPKLKVSYEARDRAIRNWEEFHIIVPDLVFDTLERIVLSQVTIELEHVGGDHAPDSIIIKVPQARTMFLGDCYYPPPLHLQTTEPVPSMAMLTALEDENYELYVEGHDDPFTRAELLEFLAGN